MSSSLPSSPAFITKGSNQRFLRIINARLPEEASTDSTHQLHTLCVADGRFVTTFDDLLDDTKDQDDRVRVLDLQGKAMVLPGLIETHLHLDKACILHRCAIRHGTLDEAIQQTAACKAAFTVDDVYRRAEMVLQRAITHGTTHVRTHVEVDPVVGLNGFHALRRLQRDYAWAVTLQICVFPQEGLHNRPGTLELLTRALDDQGGGGDAADAKNVVLGGCPYTDTDPDRHVATLFDLAVRYDVDLDFHLDFDLDVTTPMRLTEVCRQTVARGRQGRVTVGHVTRLSTLSRDRLRETAALLVASGVHVTVLPSTDLFLTGRRGDATTTTTPSGIPRGVAPLWPLTRAGVTCSLASNNVCNPFTPYGDASLIRQANLYANIAQLATAEELQQCLMYITEDAARILRLTESYGLAPGCAADFIVVPQVASGAAVIAEIRQPTMGFKGGRQVFVRPEAQILFPEIDGDSDTEE